MSAIVRLATGDDAAAIAAIYRPIVQDTPISFEIEAPDAQAVEGRILRTLKRHPWLVCEIAGDLAGYVYACDHRDRPAYRWSVDVAVYVHSAFRRRGVARALYASLFRILAAQGYRRAHAGIALPNPGSVALHESLGFESVGVYRSVGFKLGAWHDVGWWQLALGGPVEPPPASRTPGEAPPASRRSSEARPKLHPPVEAPPEPRPPAETPPEPRPLAEVTRDPSFARALEEGASRVDAHPRREGVA
jgi:phosphinothricin acetyltransferase